MSRTGEMFVVVGAVLFAANAGMAIVNPADAVMSMIGVVAAVVAMGSGFVIILSR